jgi:hypothetical protein
MHPNERSAEERKQEIATEREIREQKEIQN